MKDYGLFETLDKIMNQDANLKILKGFYTHSPVHVQFPYSRMEILDSNTNPFLLPQQATSTLLLHTYSCYHGVQEIYDIIEGIEKILTTTSHSLCGMIQGKVIFKVLSHEISLMKDKITRHGKSKYQARLCLA